MITYARMSALRKPEFRALTTIERTNGELIVRKRAVDSSNTAYVDRMLDNYTALTQLHSALFKVVQPTRENATTVSFRFIEGERLDESLYKAILAGDTAKAHEIIDRIIALIKKLPAAQHDPINNPEYVKTFGDTFAGEQQCITLGYIDFNLDNFISHQDTLYLIDYEWLFPFPLPRRLVIGRMLRYALRQISFYYRSVASASNPVVSIDDIFIPKKTYERYAKYLQDLPEILQAEYAMQAHALTEPPAIKPPAELRVAEHTAPLFPGLANRLDHAEKRLAEITTHNRQLDAERTRLLEELDTLHRRVDELTSSRTLRLKARAKRIINHEKNA